MPEHLPLGEPPCDVPSSPRRTPAATPRLCRHRHWPGRCS
uniref:Uncharacterized protein n=1 Tax=Arundo donax TaxID=35708 RepID=A0A0A9U7R7_ARUDO